MCAACAMAATGLRQHAAEVVAPLVRNGHLTCVLVLAMEMLAQRKLHCQVQVGGWLLRVCRVAGICTSCPSILNPPSCLAAMLFREGCAAGSCPAHFAIQAV